MSHRAPNANEIGSHEGLAVAGLQGVERAKAEGRQQ